MLCVQGSALQESRDIPSGGRENNAGSLSFSEAGSGSRVRDTFPFDLSVVEMVTPLSHIKNETLELNWHITEQVFAGVFGGLSLLRKLFSPSLRWDEID